MSRLRTTLGWMMICGSACLLMGCATTPDDTGDDQTVETITQDGKSIRVYFPSCFLIKDARLNDHGRIPSTPLVGAGMTIKETLSVVYLSYQDLLSAQGWTTDREENAPQSFRIMASKAGSKIEIRGVQGTAGPTQIFLLYTPVDAPKPKGTK